MSWHTPTTEFGTHICLKLINLVKQHPPLYTTTKEMAIDRDMTMGLRKSRNEMNQIWDQLAAEIGVSASDCKRRWKGLKDVYAKIRKRRLQEAVLGIAPRKKWLYEDAMSFMKFPFEQNYQEALENFEEVDCKEWKVEDMEDEEILDEPNEHLETAEEETDKQSQHDDQDEDGTVEYLDLDLEVDTVPDSEDYYSNDSVTKNQKCISESMGNKQPIQTSILKANCSRSVETKPLPKYRPIRPKPYQSSLLSKNKSLRCTSSVISNDVTSIPSIVNLSNLNALNSFIVTGAQPRKGKDNFGTVVVTSPNMKLRSSGKSTNNSNFVTSPAIKNDETPRKTKIANSSSISNNETNIINSTMKPSKGGIELFFESMAQTVMNMPLRAQAEIKMEICKVVTKAEIRYSSSQQSSELKVLPSNRNNKNG